MEAQPPPIQYPMEIPSSTLVDIDALKAIQRYIDQQKPDKIVIIIVREKNE
jgi:hypothetical protein